MWLLVLWVAVAWRASGQPPPPPTQQSCQCVRCTAIAAADRDRAREFHAAVMADIEALPTYRGADR